MFGEADLSGVLLGLARDDEFAAKSLLPVEGVADSILGFHAQQAVEKSLKAVLAHRGIEYPYSHDLDGFVELCKKNRLKVPEGLDGVDRLSEFGVRARYGAANPSGLDRDQALRWAACAVKWAESIVEPAEDSIGPADDAG
jgi:HEPN domain-containing protein